MALNVTRLHFKAIYTVRAVYTCVPVLLPQCEFSSSSKNGFAIVKKRIFPTTLMSSRVNLHKVQKIDSPLFKNVFFPTTLMSSRVNLHKVEKMDSNSFKNVYSSGGSIHGARCLF